jgi:hypothetical protein
MAPDEAQSRARGRAPAAGAPDAEGLALPFGHRPWRSGPSALRLSPGWVGAGERVVTGALRR